jgi:DNA replicative helicase MCM subunit Mcm2 (Cdc46/Mcm family)
MLATRSAIIDQFCNPSGTGIFQKRKYCEIIDRLRSDSVFTVSFLEDGIHEIVHDLKPEEVKDIMKEAVLMVLDIRFGTSMDVRNTFRNLSIRIVSDRLENMHDLNARDHENTIVMFDCEIIAVEREKTYVKKGVGFCPLCGTDYDIMANEDRKLELSICSNSRCRKQRLTLKKQSLETDNIQTIYFQEPMELARNNSPVIRRGLLVGQLCGKLYIGQKKRITAIFKSEIDLKENVNEIVLEVISEQDREEKQIIDLSPEQITKYREEARDEERFVTKLTNSYAPFIIGYHDIKLSLLLMLVGGHSTVKRADINIFLVGDPSMAKSELLKFGNKVTPKSMYTSGKGSSAAGLTIGLVKMDTGNFVAQAGVLPLCSGGFAFIDEFDKMSSDDRSALHEAMEQQTVSIAKAGFKMTLPAKTPILAAANPKYGKYDIDQTLLDNIDIPPPLISRFDLIWLIRDIINKEEDLKKATFILDTFTGTTDNQNEIFSLCELSSYLNYVRTLPVKISEETKTELIAIYSKMRDLSSSGIFVGTRQLESLVRLTMAHAKLLQKDTTDLNDVKCVKQIIDSMFKQFNVSTDISYSQDMVATTKKQTKEHVADSAWNSCKGFNGQVKYSDFIKKLVETGKFDAESAAEYFSKMERECIIKHLGDNVYVKI